MPGPIAVRDAGPIIHLDELGRLGLLGDFSRVLVPETVWREVVKYRPGFHERTAVCFDRVARCANPDPVIEAMAAVFTLHAGEREALQIACGTHDSMVLTDDTAARLAAQQLGLAVHGTLGILLRAIRRGQLSKAEVVLALRELPQKSSLHIKKSLLESIIIQVEYGI